MAEKSHRSYKCEFILSLRYAHIFKFLNLILRFSEFIFSGAFISLAEVISTEKSALWRNNHL